VGFLDCLPGLGQLAHRWYVRLVVLTSGQGCDERAGPTLLQLTDVPAQCYPETPLGPRAVESPGAPNRGQTVLSAQPGHTARDRANSPK